MRMSCAQRRLIATLGLLTLSVPLVAHHSGAMFDDTRSTTLTGTVKEFQWTSPHCWIQLLVATDKDPDEWSIEMGPPSQLFKGGWRPATLKFGQTITVVVHPMRDGSHGGLFVSIAGADGHPIGPQK